MNKKLFLLVIITTSTLLPAVATAAVIVNNPIYVSVGTTANPVYLTVDNGYAAAHDAGFITVNENNQYHTNLSIDLNTVPGSGSTVFLTNVLSLMNNTAANANVQVWINGTLPTGVHMFYSASDISYNGVSLSGTEWNSGQSIHIFNSGQVEHFGFEISGNASGNAQLSIQYSVG